MRATSPRSGAYSGGAGPGRRLTADAVTLDGVAGRLARISEPAGIAMLNNPSGDET
ncbi:hypothetical protein HBB16_16480 [Pseudonocardia sp. MCCB 268]|nr:hypothetical protein [Pseudonocardia cytotoxica]